MLRIVTETTQSVGGLAYNVFHSVGTDIADATTFAAQVEIFFQGLQSVMNNVTQTSFDGLVTVLDPATGAPTATLPGTPWNVQGSWGSGRSPEGLSLVVQWRTGVYVGAREIRGRSFIGGLGDINEGSAVVPGSVITDVQAAATTLAGGDQLGVYSPTNGQIQPVSSATCWNRFGFLRTRRV